MAVLFSGTIHALSVQQDSWSRQVGATGLSLGGAYSARAEDLSAAHWNPAALTLIPNWGFILEKSKNSHSEKRSLDIVLPRLPVVSSFLPVKNFSLGVLDSLDRNPDYNNVSSHEDRTIGFGLSGALPVNTDLSLGLTWKRNILTYNGIPGITYEVIHSGLDLGGLYRLSPDCNLSLVVQNAYENYIRPVWTLPTYLEPSIVLGASVACNWFGGKQQVSVDNVIWTHDRRSRFAWGLEQLFFDFMQVRLGWTVNNTLTWGVGVTSGRPFSPGVEYSPQATAIPLNFSPIRPVLSVDSMRSATPLVVTNNIFLVKGRAYNVMNESVDVNGTAVPLAENGEFMTSVVLGIGDNVITVSAMDRDDNLLHSNMSVWLDVPLDQTLSRTKYVALIIANQHYRYFPSLQTPFSDAKSISELLRDTYGFETRIISDAGRRDTLKAIHEMAGKLGEDDSLLIYYAGHGGFDPQTRLACWLPVDADNKKNSISSAELNVAITEIKARHVLIISDSCFAGAMTRGTFWRDESFKDLYVKRMASTQSRTLFTSGGDEPVTDSGANGHSVFANALIAALQKAPGVFTTQEIYYPVKTYVAAQVFQVPEYKLIKGFENTKGEFVFRKTK